MAIKLRYTLLVLVTILFLGSSISAQAGKPVKETSLYAGPIFGLIPDCSVTNHSATAIDVEMHLFCTRWECQSGSGSPGTRGTPITTDSPLYYQPLMVEPGQTVGWNTVLSYASAVRCEVHYLGGPADIAGSLCAENISPQSYACIPLE